MKISVVINTHNAARHLAEVLDAVADFDEVVVCDMESTDNTLAIAQARGCRIITFPKGRHTIVEPARQFAIGHATHPWVLVVDADEIVTPQLRHYLYRQISRTDCPAGIYLSRSNYFMGHFMHSHYPDHILRFFRREGTVWPPVVHAQPIVQGGTSRIPPGRRELALIHLANDTVSGIVRKTDIYTDNEVIRKQHKRYPAAAFLYRPLFRFVKAYLLKGGFRDGRAGFIRATLDAYYQFVMLAKLTERQQSTDSQAHPTPTKPV